MRKQEKLIKFPGNRLPSNISSNEYDDEFDDIEEWEVHAKLIEKKDYPGLVSYCEKTAKRFPDDPYIQYYLGEAYVLNGEYEKAIQFLTDHHREFPENPDFHYVILDALFAMGKSEDDFDWVERPVILRMSNAILNKCYEFLKPKRKPRSVCDLYNEFIAKGYLLFTEEDLLKALVNDNRFIVDNANEGIFAEVRVARKKR